MSSNSRSQLQPRNRHEGLRPRALLATRKWSSPRASCWRVQVPQNDVERFSDATEFPKSAVALGGGGLESVGWAMG